MKLKINNFSFFFMLLLVTSIIASDRVVSIDSTCSVLMPQNWVKIDVESYESPDSNLRFIIGIENPRKTVVDRFMESVLVEKHPLENGSTLDRFCKSILEQNKSYLPHFKTIDSGKTTIDELDALWRISTWKPFPSACVMPLQFFVIKDEYGYYITCTSECSDFELYKEEFGRIAKSIRFVVPHSEKRGEPSQK